MTGWEIVAVVVLLAFVALWVWAARWAIKQLTMAIQTKKVSVKMVGAIPLLAILVWLGISFIGGFFNS